MRRLALPLAALPAFLLAQAPAPPAGAPQVDQALRARITEFGQFLMSGDFRKAYAMVADDSQDFFFSTPKEKPLAYSIEDLRFNENFTQATVRVASTRRMLVGSHLIDVGDVIVDHWKLEDGKWMWFHDPETTRSTIVGPISVEGTVKPGELNPKALPPKEVTPEIIAAAAETALKGRESKPVLDKESIEFTAGKPDTQQIMVHNNYPGQIRIFATWSVRVPGITLEPAEAAIDALGDGVLKIHYEPGERIPPPAEATVEIQPFRKTYTFGVTVKPAQ